MSRVGLGLVVLLTASMVSLSCDSLTGGGPKKVVVNEQVCANVSFLNMKLGEDTKIVLDNSVHSEELSSLGLVLNEFPILITSEFRPDAQVGPTFTTVSLNALPGEEDEITVKPTFTGRYIADCQLTFTRGGSNANVQQDLTFQIVE